MMIKSTLMGVRRAVCLVKPKMDLFARSLASGCITAKPLIAERGSAELIVKLKSRGTPEPVIATLHRRNFTNDPVERPDLNLTYEQFVEIIDGKKHQIFDVRGLPEVEQTGKITEQATHIPIGEFAAAFQMTPEKFKEKYGVDMPGKEDGNVVLYCLRGIRSMGAIAMLTILGHKGVRHYPGGWEGWCRERESRK